MCRHRLVFRKTCRAPFGQLAARQRRDLLLIFDRVDVVNAPVPVKAIEFLFARKEEKTALRKCTLASAVTAKLLTNKGSRDLALDRGCRTRQEGKKA